MRLVNIYFMSVGGHFENTDQMLLKYAERYLTNSHDLQCRHYLECTREIRVMKSGQLQNYGVQLKKIATAASRDEQICALRQRKFRATLVGDPLSHCDDISMVIEASRLRLGR
jgi:hypothetical protein